MIGFSNEIISCAVAGAALANSSVLTSLLPAVVPVGNKTFPQKFFNYAGQELIIEASGIISTVVTTPGTLHFEVRLGPTNNISVAVTQELALNIVAKTNVSWALRLALQLRTVGAAASFLTMGEFKSEAVIGSPLPTVGGSGLLMIPASAPVVGTTFNSTVVNITDLMAKWSVADPANSIRLEQIRYISPN